MSISGGDPDPEAIAAAEFPLARRGYDRDEVRRLLLGVAQQVRHLHDRVALLSAELDTARRRAVSLADVDDDELARLVGEETTRVIVAGRQAAAERVQRAEAQAEAVLDAAHHDSARRRAQADETVSERLAAAERRAADMLAAAESRLAEVDELVAAEIDRGRGEADVLVQEARVVRHRMLEDLSRRRHAMRTQIEQLRAGRERLLGAYDHVRRTLDDATQELQYSLQDARVAAEEAGRRTIEEPVSVADLEEEIAAARLMGHPMVDLSTQGPSTAEVEAVLVVSEEDHVDVVVVVEVPEVDPQPSSDEVLDSAADHPEPDWAEAEWVDEEPTEGSDLPVEDPEQEHEEPQEEPAEVEVRWDEEPAPAEEPVDDVVDEEPIDDEPVERPAADVDDLFSAMRRRREERTASAEAVLEEMAASAGEAADDGPTPEPTDEPLADESPAAESPVDEPVIGPGAASPAPPAVPAEHHVADEIVRTVKRALSEEQNDVLDLVRRRQARVSIDDLYGPLDTHVARLASPLVELTGDARATQIAGAVLAVLRRRVDTCLSEDSGDVDEVLNRIRSIYRDVRSHRVRELVNASGAAA